MKQLGDENLKFNNSYFSASWRKTFLLVQIIAHLATSTFNSWSIVFFKTDTSTIFTDVSKLPSLHRISSGNVTFLIYLLTYTLIIINLTKKSKRKSMVVFENEYNKDLIRGFPMHSIGFIIHKCLSHFKSNFIFANSPNSSFLCQYFNCALIY